MLTRHHPPASPGSSSASASDALPEEGGFIVLPRHEDCEESLQQCCQQLRQIDQQQCRCKGPRQIVQQQRQRGELQGQQLREVVQKAQNLPNRCGLGHQQCNISSSGGGGD